MNKRTIIMFLVVVMMFSLSSATAFAASQEDLAGSEIVKVEVVLDGVTTVYEGEEATNYIKQKEEETKQQEQQKHDVKSSLFLSHLGSNKVQPQVVTYDYRYAENGRIQEYHRTSLKQRITEIWKNQTSGVCQ